MPSRMCIKLFVGLLLLVIPYGVSALAAVFLSDAGQHVRGRIPWLTSCSRRSLGIIGRRPLERRQAATRPLGRLRSSWLRPSSEVVSTRFRHETGFVLTGRGESKDSEGGGDDDAFKKETRVVLESYASRHSTPESAALASVLKDTIREHPRGAHMVSGHLQGELLKLLTRLCGAKKVLDIGTFTGYSALAFAEALPEDGMVITLESDERAAETARRYFTDSDHGGKIRLLLGQAMDTIDELIAEDVWQFDVIFIDADKRRYWDYYNKVLEGPRPLLAKGGVLLADNVLFHDMVPMAEENASEENPKLSDFINGGSGGGKGGDIFVPTPRRLKIARSLDEFNKRVQGDDRVKVLLLPLRDGLSVIRWREGRYPN